MAWTGRNPYPAWMGQYALWTCCSSTMQGLCSWYLPPLLVMNLQSVPIAESGKLRKLAGEVTWTLAALLSRTVKYVVGIMGLTR